LAAASGNVYVLHPCVVRSGIKVTVRREHTLDANVLAHDLRDVVVGAHEDTILVQAKSRAKFYRDGGKMLNVGFEIRYGKDDASWACTGRARVNKRSTFPNLRRI
jgi:hypothetical protein